MGLSGAQLYVLQKLGESEGCSINQLADRTLTHQSSVSVVVGRLARRKLAVRRKSRQDARRAEIFLTAKGRALLRRAPEPVQARLVGAIDALPRADRTKLARNLATIVEAAGIGEGPAPLFFEEMAQ